jgi:hypothetical protein
MILTASFFRFFVYVGYLVLTHTMAIGLFRMMGAIGREESRINTYGSFVLLLVVLLGGFILAKSERCFSTTTNSK